MTARDDFEDLWTLAEEEKRKNEEKQTQESNMTCTIVEEALD
jgi:hypothetical protein